MGRNAKYLHVDYSGLPQHIQDEARLYVEHGIEPGSFLTAVICNDLTNAVGRADHYERERLPDIVSWFSADAPSECWGSREKMAQWIAARNREAA